MKYLIVFPVLLLAFGLSAQERHFAADVESVDAIVAALYDVISGPAGQPRNWDRMRYLFKPDARLRALGKGEDGKVRYVSMSVDDYIERNGDYLIENGFFEEEIGRQTDTFGLITQLFSAYATRRTAEGEVFMRGINSIQIVREADRYWIVSVLWNSETPENPIPERYLN